MKTISKFTIAIRWGAYGAKENRPVTTREFDTIAEVNAYIQGIDDMDGWYDYEIVDEKRENPLDE